MTLAASDRVSRLLAIVPFVAARRDGVPVDELCSRFAIDRKRLLADLATLSLVGVEPYTPDAMIELVHDDDDRVYIFLPQWFDRPLRFTRAQGLALLVAGRSALAVPGAEPEGPLARGLAKVASALGAVSDDTLAVDLGDAEASTMRALTDAIDDHRRVRIEYYAYNRDEHTQRVVDPSRVFATGGYWYLAGWCHLAREDRLFRVDRITGVTVLDEHFTPPERSPGLEVFVPSDDDPRVTLRLAPAARWVAEQYPVDARRELGDGRVEVTLAVTAVPWLERLLLRLGRDAELVVAPPALRNVARDAARRVLARYRNSDTSDVK